MYRTGFSDEARAEFGENSIYRCKDSPESMRIFRLVCSVYTVLIKQDRMGHFHRHLPDLHLDLRARQKLHEFPMELRYRTRDQRQGPDPAVAGEQRELVVDEVE